MRITVRMRGPLDGGAGAEMLHGAGSGDQRRDDGDESTRLGGRETEHGVGALDGEAGGRGCALGVGMQRHQREGEVETVAHVQGGSGEVSRACRRSADHGHRDEHAAHSVPTRRGAFAGWDAQGGELPYRRLHVETSWQATLLGRGPGERGGALGSAGAQVEAGTAMLHRCLQVVAARPSSIGQTGWPDRGYAFGFGWE